MGKINPAIDKVNIKSTGVDKIQNNAGMVMIKVIASVRDKFRVTCLPYNQNRRK